MSTSSDKLVAFFNDDQKELFKSFSAFGADEKLAILYYIYTKMGDSITPAAPEAADPDLAPLLMGDFYELSKDDQLAVMREIVNKTDTEYSRAYGALTENNQLVVWFAWAVGMGDTVVGMPNDYSATDGMNRLIGDLEGMDFESQISVLRAIASDMGYSSADAVVTQKNTTKTDNVTDI
ncbi:MAG: orange carotenoid protein N-terminal domain-containing protein [Elainellaceae cyanobacterium]